MPDGKISADPEATLVDGTIFPVVTPGSPNTNERTKLSTLRTNVQNGMVPNTRAVNTTAPLSGGGDLSADRTVAFLAQAANLLLAGPTSGGSAAPTFRAPVIADLRENTFWGTYTPTFTAVANVDSVSGGTWFWLRLGNVVIVAGRLTVDPTNTALTQVGISLPIASNLFTADDAAGGSGSQGGTSGQFGVIYADGTNDRAEMAYTAAGTNAVNRWCMFMYFVR